MQEDVFAHYQQEIQEVFREAKTICLVNAGRMNHGKSSLFNSLLDREAFKADDVRVTVVSQPVEWKVAGKSVMLVDTPGLDAQEEDNAQAYAAYQKATAILFVHTVKTGELHRDELEHLNRIRKLFPSDAYFWKHFYLVLTFREEVDDDGLQSIVDESLRLIEEKCGGRGFPVFSVSNVRYAKGRREGKKGLVGRSGIPALRSAIEEAIGKWRKDMTALAERRVRRLKKQATAELKAIRQTKIEALETKWQKLTQEVNRKKTLYEKTAKELEVSRTELTDLETEAEELWDEYRALKERHQRECY